MGIHTKLVLGGAIMAAAVGYVAYLGASSSWQYYVLVDECVAAPEPLTDRRLRVSGRVAAKSLRLAADRSEAAFVLEGSRHKLPVRCAGPLPDNLREGMEVVVEGGLQSDGRLEGDKVITRCASKYAPQESSGP
jgi:cytochrome c-type biogenesis protein CcmE